MAVIPTQRRPKLPFAAMSMFALLSLAHPLPAHRAVLLEPTTPRSDIIDPVGCLRDANVNQNMCGETAGATCTGSHSPGKCCASTGWCGSTDSHCGNGMQAEYSHSRGLCPSAVMEIAQQEEEENFDSKTSQCVSMQQIANAWVVATQGRSETDAQTLCVPAIIVAAGFTYGVSEECPTKFALKVDTTGESGGKPLFLKGLWQVNESVYDREPELQAGAVYDRFNATCSTDKCYKMADQCSDKLAVDVKDEHERFCSRWCCALLVASGRLGVASATNFRVNDLKKSAEDHPDDVPMVIIGSSGGCTSLAESPGDDWCTATCLDSMDSNPTCPTLCQCDGKHNEQAVDYDPIAQANTQQEASGVATPPVQAPAPTQVPAPTQAPAPAAAPVPAAEAATPPVAEAAVPMTTNFRVNDLKKSAEDHPDDVPMVIIGSSGGCTSLAESPGDDWCTATCLDSMDSNPTCPTLCQCDGKHNEQAVDYDPIAQANTQQEASGVATPPVQAPAPTQVPAPTQAPAPAAAPVPAAEAATPPVAEAAVPMVIVGADDSCRSLTDSASDEWCAGTCKGNMETNPSCPTLCECADASNKMEKVDIDPISAAIAANDAAKQVVADAATNAPVPASSAAMTGEAGRDHLLIEGLGGIGDVEKACVQAMTARGNPHAGHIPSTQGSVAR